MRKLVIYIQFLCFQLRTFFHLIKIEIHFTIFHFEIHFKNPLKAMYKAEYRYNYGKTNHLTEKQLTKNQGYLPIQ